MFAMAIDEFASRIPDRTAAPRVSLSRWVNEGLPSCQELLTAHDVARLTRRRRWILETLTLFGRFPRKQRFHGRRVGWRRRDVLLWLGADNSAGSPTPCTLEISRTPLQRELYLRHPPCYRSRSHRPRCSSARSERVSPACSRRARSVYSPAESNSGFPVSKESTSAQTSETP